jgi:hypothetical protein
MIYMATSQRSYQIVRLQSIETDDTRIGLVTKPHPVEPVTAVNLPDLLILLISRGTRRYTCVLAVLIPCTEKRCWKCFIELL